jgi:diguanylate cyclase (GGDEF)-like protein/PAS domain S-box-containing protein
MYIRDRAQRPRGHPLPGRAAGEGDAYAVAALEGIEAVLREERERFTLEYPCHGPDEERWFLLSATPFRNAGPGAVVSHLDVTERKRASREVERARDRLAAVFQLSPEPIVVSRADTGELVDVNDAFCAYHGYERDELVGESALDLELWCDPAERAAIVTEVERTGSASPREVCHTTKDAGVRHGVISARSLELEGQGLTLFVVHDVTERRKAEEEIRRSEKRYRSLFEDSRDAIVTVSPEGRILDANRAALELSGYDRDAVREIEVDELCADPGQVAPIVAQLDRDGSVKDVDLRVRRMDDTEIECLLTSSATHGPDGEVLCYQMIVRDVTDMKRLQRQLEQRALHDWLTELPNRALLRNRLQQALGRSDRDGKPFALLFLDLDRFRQVNDSLGHPAGDRLLVELARRLKGVTRQQDTVARVGGDEFMILIEGLEGPEAADAAVRRVVDTASAPFELGASEVGIDVSVGLVVYRSREDCGCGVEGRLGIQSRADELVRRSELAKHRAKERPGSRYHLFDPDVDHTEGRGLERESALRRALEREELEVHYQPVVDLQSGRVCGLEALARWHSPEQGWISPGMFIPLAEETGLIEPLGQWILDRALGDFGKELSTLGSVEGGLQLFVNLSPVQLDDPDLSGRIGQALERHGVDPPRVSFEVTETAVTRSVDRVRSLRDLGVKVAIDDFGTGYSSLGNLRHFQVDTLKIDMEFIRGIGVHPEDEAIVRTIINLGKTLRTEVVAEGVEEKAQLEILRSLGCDRAQGYLFSRALPLDEVLELLADEPIWR